MVKAVEVKALIFEFNKLLKSRKISAKELAKKYIEAIKREDGKLNSYVYLNEELALKIAEIVDCKLKNGEEISILEGLPFTLKDNISTKNIPTSCCSKILKGYVPIYDAFVWEILKNKNSVLLGKTNMDEFAMGSTCETSCFGGAKNPHNVEHVAGGSSGGVASAVAAGLAVYGLGSDTGGSIRQPASFCGAVGLKPTYGAVSRYGLVAFASSLDQIGPITATVEDAALVFDEISLKDEQDCTCLGAREKTFSNIKDNINGVKVGVAKEFLDLADEDVKKSISLVISVYEKMGANVEYISLPSCEYALMVYYILACAEASSNLGRYDGIRYGSRVSSYKNFHDMICKTRSEGFGKEVKRRILLGTYVLSCGYYDAYYKKAYMVRSKIIDEFNEAFKNCDVILTPTTPTTAFECGYSAKDPISNYRADICTVPVNIAGLPAVSVPCGFDEKNLPIGFQIIGKKFEESKILNVANKFEEYTDACYVKKVRGGVYPYDV